MSLNTGKFHVTAGTAIVGNEPRIPVARIILDRGCTQARRITYSDCERTVRLQRSNTRTAWIAASKFTKPSCVRRQSAISKHILGRNDLIVKTTEKEHLVLYPGTADGGTGKFVVKSRRLRE